ncbi:MAG: AMP-binding protein, partial [Spirochaetales bacterium]
MIGSKKEIKTPWITSYGKVKASLDYPLTTLFEEFEKTAKKYPLYTAYEFYGKKTTYTKALGDIITCAKALVAEGIEPGQSVTVCLPNCPQSVTSFYAINMIGAIANMIHPLSSPKEIEFYLRDSKSTAAITLDQFVPNFETIRSAVAPFKMIVATLKDSLPILTGIGYVLTQGRKITKINPTATTIPWKTFIENASGKSETCKAQKSCDDLAVILYSGGTTGVSKGIMLSSKNFNALSYQIIAMDGFFTPKDKMLAVIPMFHGFGLGISIHTMLVNGGHCILVPRFDLNSYAKILKTKKPNYIAGVPSIFEALLRLPNFGKADLSFLKGVFAGGDSLSVSLKKRFDSFLHEHNASITIREGYGTTECVTASCLTPYNKEKEGSIGIPLPDMLFKIVKPGTQTALDFGDDGEICIAGPTVMMGYANQKEETDKTLQKHRDGETWIHTGDLGNMDADGFIYFKQRIKRMIITNGYNIYPGMIENALEAHPTVHISCVIGIQDALKGQRIKAYIVLKDGYKESEELKNILREHCKEHIAKYALPSEFEFRADLPKTKVGKVAYRELEEEAEK